MVHYEAHEATMSIDAACFIDVYRYKASGFTYHITVPGSQTQAKIDRFAAEMTSIGFEINYSTEDLKPGYQLKYHIDTKPRELFNNTISNTWIIANLMIARYVSEDIPVVNNFLSLLDRFPDEDRWFLFYVANCFVNPYNNANHKVVSRPFQFKAFDKVIETLKQDKMYQHGSTLRPPITSVFTNGENPKFSELARKYADIQKTSQYSAVFVLPENQEEAIELLKDFKEKI